MYNDPHHDTHCSVVCCEPFKRIKNDENHLTQPINFCTSKPDYIPTEMDVDDEAECSIYRLSKKLSSRYLTN